MKVEEVLRQIPVILLQDPLGKANSPSPQVIEQITRPRIMLQFD